MKEEIIDLTRKPDGPLLDSLFGSTALFVAVVVILSVSLWTGTPDISRAGVVSTALVCGFVYVIAVGFSPRKNRKKLIYTFIAFLAALELGVLYDTQYPISDPAAAIADIFSFCILPFLMLLFQLYNSWHQPRHS